MAKLIAAHPVVRGVQLTFDSSSAVVELDAFWLRDHDESSLGMDPVTKQRRVDTLGLPDDLEVRATEIQEHGEWLEVTWAEHVHTTRHSAAALYRALHPDSLEYPEPSLWLTPTEILEIPEVDFDDVREKTGLRSLFGAVWKYGFCLVKNAPPTAAATETVVRAVAYPRQTIFGGMWTFGATGEFEDTAYSTERLPLHTDGTYTLDPPGWQLLHCIEYDGSGGDSLIADGVAHATAMKNTSPDHYQALCDIPVIAEYRGDDVHLRAAHPVVEEAPCGRIRRFMYNNTDRVGFRRNPDESKRFYDAYRDLGRRLAAEEAALGYPLRPGTILVFDNWRVLHGRTEFSGNRVLSGAYLNREDVESRWRCLLRD